MRSPQPSTPLLDDELLAALGEGRLSPSEEAAALVALRAHPAQLAAFRDLFPQRAAELLPEIAEPCEVIPLRPGTLLAPVETASAPADAAPAALAAFEPTPPMRRQRLGLVAFGLVASFGVTGAIVAPARAPADAHAYYQGSNAASELVRTGGPSSGDAASAWGLTSAAPSAAGSAPETTRSTAPRRVRGGGEAGKVLVDLGAVGFLERLRGLAPWGAVVVAGPDGRPTVLATSARPGECFVGEGTLSCFTHVPAAKVVVLISAGPADAPLDALVNHATSWDDFEHTLTSVEGQHPWKVSFPLEQGADPR